MPKPLQPPELDALVDFAERPREADWSLRAALVRYACGEPQRVSDLLEQVRRIEGVFHGHRKQLEQQGPDLWAALRAGDDGLPLVGVLGAARDIDTLSDQLAAWAVDRSIDAPDADVDRVTADVGARLDAIGVPREDRDGWPRGGGRGV